MPLQTGALPWRLTQSSKPEVLLVTGRRSGRWMIPKGWPMIGKSLAAAAEREAFEEAGISGSIDSRPLGSFRSGVGFGDASANSSAPAAQRSYLTPTVITGGTGI